MVAEDFTTVSVLEGGDMRKKKGTPLVLEYHLEAYVKIWRLLSKGMTATELSRASGGSVTHHLAVMFGHGILRRHPVSGHERRYRYYRNRHKVLVVAKKRNREGKPVNLNDFLALGAGHPRLAAPTSEVLRMLITEVLAGFAFDLAEKIVRAIEESQK